MRYLFLILLVSCGTNEDPSNGGEDESKESERINELSTPAISSIALDSASDLPECLEANKSQLAYIIEEGEFYVCQSDWKKVSIKGAKGDKGDSGSNGSNGTNATNQTNTWADETTGLTWLLGANGNYGHAVIACTSPYRIPTKAEGVTAVYHGIRIIAAGLSLNQDFWVLSDPTINTPPFYPYIYLSGGLPTHGVTSGDLKSMFCVK